SLPGVETLMTKTSMASLVTSATKAVLPPDMAGPMVRPQSRSRLARTSSSEASQSSPTWPSAVARRRTRSGTENQALSAMSDTPDCLEANAWMNFVLAHDHGLRAEALDDGADMRTDRGRGDEHGQFALLGGALIGGLDGADELLQPAGGHGQMPVVAIADHGFGEVAFPLRAKCEQRQVAIGTQIGGAELAGKAAADMFGDHLHRAAGAGDLGNAFQDGREIADGDALVE